MNAFARHSFSLATAHHRLLKITEYKYIMIGVIPNMKYIQRKKIHTFSYINWYKPFSIEHMTSTHK